MNRDLLVFSGTSNPDFTDRLCNSLKISPGSIDQVRFSDGELFVEINENVRGRDVFLVQSTSSPGNDHLMELLITLDALKRASAWRVTAVIPYYGYSRQDRKLKPRVPITARLIADLLTTAGASRVLTMDLHSGQIMGFFDIPVDNLNAIPVAIPYLQKKYAKKNITVVSPDSGGVERAREYATRLGNTNIAIIDKRRSGPNQIAEMHIVGEIRDRLCVIVDDMVDTGSTLIKAAEALMKDGASGVVACCSHGILSGDAALNLAGAPFQEIILTDSIKRAPELPTEKFTTLSVAPLFADAIQRIHHEDSISSLFQ